MRTKKIKKFYITRQLQNSFKNHFYWLIFIKNNYNGRKKRQPSVK